MTIILELDPVELWENMFDPVLEDDTELGFLSLDRKPDWSIETDNFFESFLGFEQKPNFKFNNIQQDLSPKIILNSQISQKVLGQNNSEIKNPSVGWDSATESENFPGNSLYLKNSAEGKLDFKNINSKKRKKRKRITVRRDTYKKRQDVWLKSWLRKFRKYYQEEYLNFMRTKFLESEEDNIFVTANDFFLIELERRYNQKLTIEGLELFAKSMTQKSGIFEKFDIHYFGLLISPRTFKDDLKKNIIKVNNGSQRKKMIENCQLVNDVLYKFSHQKLNKFCSIPEFGMMFKYYSDNSSLTSDETNQEYMKILLSKFNGQ